MVLVSNATRNGYMAECPSNPNKDNLRIISRKKIAAGKFTALNKWKGEGAVDHRQRKCHQRVQLLALMD